jgi:alkanesulfonate monooxygenase SsuD/methylene tetrahydromethanopterin reductase-like flavin-dependent oxidoreductase (luciferase family)
MRFAVTMPNFGAFSDVRKLAKLAREAEDAGWDGFFIWDHIHWTQQPMSDPWVALAAIALATERVRIGPMVTPLARRRPWKLAREAVTVDHLSNGRLILGAGLGFPPDEEFAALGEETDARVRGEKLDEGLAVLAGLWSGEPFAFEGRHYHLEGATFLPKPLQQPRIPIWCAAMWPNRAPVRRAARWDGIFPMKVQSSDRFEALSPDDVQAIVSYVKGRRGSVEGFDVVIGAPFPAAGRSARDVVHEYEAAGATWLIYSEGSPDEMSELLRAGPPR